MIGWGKPFRITRLQMERIISSKGQKPLQPDAEPLLREQRVSNHLPHRKSEASNTDITDIKTPLRDAEGTFDGVRWCDDDTERFIFLHFFIFLLTGHLGNFSVTHCTVTSCGFIGQGLLSSTLVKLSTPLQRPPDPPTPPSLPSTYTKMLTCWSTDPVVTIREMNQGFQGPGVTVWRFQESIFLSVLSSAWTWGQKQSWSFDLCGTFAHSMSPFQIPLPWRLKFLYYQRENCYKVITLHHYLDTHISAGGVWFIVRESGSAGIHQRSDTPNRPFLCLLETAHSTAFPGTDHVSCELFIAHAAPASANAWICSETEWDARRWYSLKRISPDVHVATCGQVWSRLRRWPRSSLSNQVGNLQVKLGWS